MAILALPAEQMKAGPARSARNLTLGAALVSMLPLLVYWREFQLLFFFHDDWELLDGYSTNTLPHWLAQPFLGEGILPLFKLLWIAAVELLSGSYLAMIVLLWLTHLLIALWFGRILYRLSVPAEAIGFSVLMFGLAWTNLETLTWSMQWGAQLGILFLLAAWRLLPGILERNGGARMATAGYALCLLASGLCSTRGIVSGVVLAAFILFCGTNRRNLRLCAISLAPSAVLAMAMWLFAPHRHADLWPAVSYALHYLLLNPFYLLISIPRKVVDARALLIFGTCKVLVIAVAFRRSNRKSYPLLLTLLAFDFATAAALGYGRSYTGLATTVSSRYQYISLLCFAPMAGWAFASLRREAQVMVLLLSMGLLGYPWRRHIPTWAAWRGAEIRMALDRKADSERFDPSSLTAGRARQLIRQYRLH